MAIINQFSFVISAVLTGAILAVVLWRWKRLPLPIWLRVVMLALYIVGAIALGVSRRYPDSSVTTLAEAEARLTNEQPTFVMLYSNY